MFACSTYPALRRARSWPTCGPRRRTTSAALRHHACIALWCGNNELEQGLVGDAWTDRTDELGGLRQASSTGCCPRWCAALDPERDYWPCSPHTPLGDRDELQQPDAAATRTCGTSGTAASPSSGTAPASTASTASSASSPSPSRRPCDGYTDAGGPQRHQLRDGAPPAQRHRQHGHHAVHAGLVPPADVASRRPCGSARSCRAWP